MVDGTGNPWFRADLAIRDNAIAAIGDLGGADCKQRIDAAGLVVAPGFIDVHSHSDFPILVNPKAESKIRQGVTTEIIGNCGSSAAPLNDMQRSRVRQTPYLVESGVQINWSTMGEYFLILERTGIALNIAALVGHGNLRAYAMGFERRSPTSDELVLMQKLAVQALQEGAVGLSTGLIYTPGSYSQTKEIISIARAIAQLGGIYTSHIRNESHRLVHAVREAIRIGKEAHVPVEISHHKAAGKSNWGKIRTTLKIIEAARQRGIDVTCDVYPYIASSFSLTAMLPPWAHEGGPAKLLKRLQDPASRIRLRRDIQRGTGTWPSPLKSAGWDKTIIASSHRSRSFQGRSISDLAKQKRMDPFEFMLDLLLREQLAVGVIRFGMCEDDVEHVLSYPNTMIGSDGSTYAPTGPLGSSKPHPRSYGTFPRVLGKYARERGLFPLEEAVRKMTSLPAQRFSLKLRGLIREGSYADLCLFDPNRVEDLATFHDPHRFPRGIEYVIVNGKTVVSKGQHTGSLPGRVLRKDSAAG